MANIKSNIIDIVNATLTCFLEDTASPAPSAFPTLMLKAPPIDPMKIKHIHSTRYDELNTARLASSPNDTAIIPMADTRHQSDAPDKAAGKYIRQNSFTLADVIWSHDQPGQHSV